MSGSDSDLDYQSADDDTEFDSNLKSSTEEKQLDSQELSNSDETKHENVVNNIHGKISPLNDVDEQSSETNIGEKNVHTESNLKSNEILPSDEKEKECQDISINNASSKVADEEISEESPCKDGKKGVSKELDKPLDECEDKSAKYLESNKHSKALKEKDDAIKPVHKGASNASEEEESQKSSPNETPRETPRENQRVVLRLEKLINQKQQKPKEVSPLKEKPSDLVNMLQEPPKLQQSSWGFGSWGTSLLSSAASSVSTFSSQVSQGIGTVLETVESTLGAPGPEELAKALNERKKEQASSSANTDDPALKGDASKDDQTDSKLGLLPDVSFFTKVIENTGSKVIMGGLDTLEFIGKKTMNILTEGDPGLRSKRSLFGDGVNLSEILREAKTRAEQEQEDNPDDKDNIHYGQVFDEKQGLVHLEALEILSKQSQVKFQRLLMRHSKKIEVKKKLEEIKSICENLPSFDDPSESEQFDDFETVFKKHSIELSIPLNVDNIIKTQRMIHDTICKFESSKDEFKSAPKDIFNSAISSLAEFTAKSIETFHKTAELILVQPNVSKDVELCATNLTGLTTVMCIEINNLSSRYHKCLDSSNENSERNAGSDSVDITALATNLYVEAANSNNYIQDAYQMIVPILQVWVLEALEDN